MSAGERDRGAGCGHACADPCVRVDALPPGLDRRTFLAAAAALALTACSSLDSLTGPSSIGSSIDVTSYSSLAANGGVAVVTLQNTPLAIVRTGDTTFLALSLICPHQGSTISAFSNGFQCPRHGATFDKNGKWIGGQPTSSMRSYPATYDPATHKLTIG